MTNDVQSQKDDPGTSEERISPEDLKYLREFTGLRNRFYYGLQRALWVQSIFLALGLASVLSMIFIFFVTCTAPNIYLYMPLALFLVSSFYLYFRSYHKFDKYASETGTLYASFHMKDNPPKQPQTENPTS